MTPLVNPCAALQAIAIIRQKPEGVSAFEFTFDLAQQFKGEELHWKGRARQLEQELLRTRQELVRTRLQAALVTSQSTHGKLLGNRRRSKLY